MRPVVQTFTPTAAPQQAPPIILDQYLDPTNVGISVTQAATITGKLQVCLDDPFAVYATDYATNGNWVDAVAADATGTLTLAGAGTVKANLVVPVRAVRWAVTAWASGSVTTTVVQAGGPRG